MSNIFVGRPSLHRQENIEILKEEGFSKAELTEILKYGSVELFKVRRKMLISKMIKKKLKKN